MHIAIFIDQPVSTLGGVQTSVVLQKKYLEKLGHTVTICQPAPRINQVTVGGINIPSYGIGSEYRAYIPTKRRLHRLAQLFKSLPPVDIVHVQADYWGAISGLFFAKSHHIPVVMTCHTNVEIGMRQVVGTLGMKVLTLYFSILTARLLGGPHLGSWTDPWALTRHLAQWAQLVLAPSRHFAKHLEKLGVAKHVTVMSNGIDDDSLDHIQRRPSKTPSFVWLGRMSREKRLVEFMQAIDMSHVPAQFEIFGDGAMRAEAESYVQKHGLSSRVTFHGKLSHNEVLNGLASADVYVQTSIGFETQGMTVFEAMSLGTPAIICDPNIADDFPPEHFWAVKSDTIADLSATLKLAYQDLIQHKRQRVVLGKDYNFRQSAMTAQATKLYASILSR